SGQAAGRDRRRSAEPGRNPIRLLLPSPVFVRPGQLRAHCAAAACERRPAARVSNRPVGRAMSALEVRDVVVDYEARGGGRVRAVAGASLAVEPGQIVGLVGESGCGKSSLARAAVGLVTPTAGSVLFEGAPVTPLTRRARPPALVRLQLV